MNSAISKALNLLNIRPRSEDEIRKLLAKKDFLKEEIEDAVCYLKKLDYINDQRFIESWVYFRQHVSPRGRWFVKRELNFKGISEEYLDRYFEDLYSTDKEKEIVMTLTVRWKDRLAFRSLPGKGNEPERFKKKLLRRGFNPNLIEDVFYLLQVK